MSVAERHGLEVLAQRRGYDASGALLSVVVFARTARDALAHLCIDDAT